MRGGWGGIEIGRGETCIVRGATERLQTVVSRITGRILERQTASYALKFTNMLSQGRIFIFEILDKHYGSQIKLYNECF